MIAALVLEICDYREETALKVREKGFLQFSGPSKHFVCKNEGIFSLPNGMSILPDSTVFECFVL